MKNRRHFRRACGRKVKYETSQQARSAAFLVSNRLRAMLTYYQCKYCGGWHIGHPPRHIKQSILDKRRQRKLQTETVWVEPEQKPEPELTPEQQEQREAKMRKHQEWLKRRAISRVETTWFDDRTVVDDDLLRLSMLVSQDVCMDELPQHGKLEGEHLHEWPGSVDPILSGHG